MAKISSILFSFLNNKIVGNRYNCQIKYIKQKYKINSHVHLLKYPTLYRVDTYCQCVYIYVLTNIHIHSRGAWWCFDVPQTSCLTTPLTLWWPSPHVLPIPSHCALSFVQKVLAQIPNILSVYYIFIMYFLKEVSQIIKCKSYIFFMSFFSSMRCEFRTHHRTILLSVRINIDVPF